MDKIILIIFLFIGSTICAPTDNQNVHVQVPSGYELVQGDMLVEKGTTRNANIRATKWANGVVPYFFDPDSSFTQQERNLIMSAMTKISQATNNCIRFIARTTETSYITFNALLNGCFSSVGRQTNAQTVSIQRNRNGAGCMYEGIVIHEVLHAMGFEHEQTRPDRDSYVRIFPQNIQKGLEKNFFKYETATIDTMGFPYDYSSIMHYSATDFSSNGQPTILPIDSKVDFRQLGQRNELSQIDIQKILRFYQCSAPTTTTTAITTTRGITTTTRATTTTRGITTTTRATTTTRGITTTTRATTTIRGITTTTRATTTTRGITTTTRATTTTRGITTTTRATTTTRGITTTTRATTTTRGITTTTRATTTTRGITTTTRATTTTRGITTTTRATTTIRGITTTTRATTTTRGITTTTRATTTTRGITTTTRATTTTRGITTTTRATTRTRGITTTTARTTTRARTTTTRRT